MISLGASAYQRQIRSVRLSRANVERAKAMQKMGWTFREIAQAIDVTVEAVQRSLYWELRK